MVESLQSFTRETDRVAVLDALGTYRDEAAPYCVFAVAELLNPATSVRTAAVEVLARAGDPTYLAALAEVLVTDKSDTNRRWALDALAAVPQASSVHADAVGFACADAVVGTRVAALEHPHVVVGALAARRRLLPRRRAAVRLPPSAALGGPRGPSPSSGPSG